MLSRWVGPALGMGIGAGVALQARINGALGERLQDGIAAAVVSFGTGLFLLVVAFLLSTRLRTELRRVRGALADGILRPWQLLGGLFGAGFVATQGLTVAALGVTSFTVAVVAGQLLSSLVVDRLGLAPSGRTPVTVMRVAGAVLAVAAVLLAGSGGGEPQAFTAMAALPEIPTPLLIALPAAAGIGLAWQQAVNGQVGAAGGPIAATLINFTAGLTALLVIETAVLIGLGRPNRFPTEPWLYLGGPLGVVFIAAGVLVVRRIGVLLLGLTSVAGQLLASVLLDWALPTGPGLSPTALLGCALTLIAVLVGASRQGDHTRDDSGRGDRSEPT
ncbi:DMT family transporter [Nocardia paucivorans]|uniref:DMT family transporter n=1 Tax=Nocardia paucivorans TaxID=114259 RepID=UPI0002E0AD75|nr:DMT family transporter [Nocardia paucivorans]